MNQTLNFFAYFMDKLRRIGRLMRIESMSAVITLRLCQISTPRVLAIFTALVFCLPLVFGGSAEAKPRGTARIAVDAHSGEILFANRSNVRWRPASLTKMMTLYQLFSAVQRRKLSMNTWMVVSRRAARQPASKLGLRPGNRIQVKKAIEALAVKSANDVAVVVAEALAGSEVAFARRMNKTARWLGMSGTNFRNSSGLHHSKQYTTARDMAILSVALMRDFPQYYKFFKQKTFRFGRRYYSSHNKILSAYKGADGIKTGYISKSGYNLASSAIRGDKRVVAIVLGAGSSNERTRLMSRLFNHSFKVAAQSGRTRIARPLPIRLRPLPPVPKPRYLPRITNWPRVIPVPLPRPGKPLLTVQARPKNATASRTAGKALPPVRSVPVAARHTGAGSSGATSGYGVQIGAFASQKLARKQLSTVLSRLPARYGAAQTRVVARSGKRTSVIYRARLSGYRTRAAAAATCEWLQSNDTDCLIVNESG